MLEGRHEDMAEQAEQRKSGWFYRTYHFTTDSREYEKIAVKACDYDHAIKQAKRWGRRCGFTVKGET